MEFNYFDGELGGSLLTAVTARDTEGVEQWISVIHALGIG